MNQIEIYKTKLELHKDIVFAHSEKGYFIENGDILNYCTFFEAPIVSCFLNISAKIILLCIDGEQTLQQVFKKSFSVFEGVEELQYVYDFMNTINQLERIGVIYSNVDHLRACGVNAHKIRKKVEAVNDLRVKYL